MSALRTLAVLFILVATSVGAQQSGLVTERPDSEGVATRVSIGFFLIDVAEIDDVAQTFKADVVATLSWMDPRLALPPDVVNRADRVFALGQIWDPALTLVNRRSAHILAPDLARVTADGGVTFEARRFAELASPLDLRDFPFDVQVLRMDIASTRYGPDEVELVVDDTRSGRLGDFSIAGWRIELGEITVSQIDLQQGERLVRVVQHLNAEREGGFFVMKVIVPLGLIVFMAATVFWVDPENIGPQLGISTASVLTLIAFQFSLVRMLPPVSYLTRIDLFVLGSMFLVFMALAESIYTSRITKAGRHDAARRVDHYARWIYGATFVLLVIFTLVV